MIRPPSNQKVYDEHWSGDEAFVQLPKAPAADSDDAGAVAVYKAALASHQQRWRIARETGDITPLLVGTEQPTKFQLRPVPGNVFREIIDRVTAGEIGAAATNTLMLRAALVGVVGLADMEVRVAVDQSYPKLGKIATVDVPNFLDRVDPSIVAELATVIRERCLGVSPKS